MINFDRELLKGSTAILILTMLKEQPMYGYQLAKELEERSGKGLKFKEGTLYPALHKLENQGLVKGEWQPQPEGPDRKYYHLTPQGEAVLAEKTAQWHSFVGVMERVLGGAPGGKA